MGASRWVGVSTHTLEQLDAADRTSADYIAFGPVFPTSYQGESRPGGGIGPAAEARAAHAQAAGGDRRHHARARRGHLPRRRRFAGRDARSDCCATIRHRAPVQFLEAAARVRREFGNAGSGGSAARGQEHEYACGNFGGLPAEPMASEHGFVRGLGLFDSTMIVVGSMIGSGIFIVSADIARQTGSAGGLLTPGSITGVLTICAALSYGELAAMMPKAGGQYVYLRESYSPLWGFLYGWTLFLVIQTGTIAAVAVAFARFLGVLCAGDFADGLDRRADAPLRQICAEPFLAAVLRHSADRVPDRREYARAATGQVHPEYLHFGEDAGADWAGCRGHLPGAQCRRHSGQFREPLGRPGRTDHRARGGFSAPAGFPRCRPLREFGVFSSPTASRRWARSFPPTPGTTSPSRPAK